MICSQETVMTYRGKVRGGVVVLEGDAKLPDGTVVSVEPVEQAVRPAAEEEQQLDELARMAELAVDTGIPDLSINHDHYLYGHPKVTEARESDE
jgi:hypothetical protein